MKRVQRNEILDLGAYEEIRDRFRARVIEDKKRRRVALGEHMTVLFENHDTALFQIQEMVRTERMTQEKAILHELETFNTLVPDKDELSATVFVEYEDKAERDHMLEALAGVEERFYVSVNGERVSGRPEQRGDRTDRTTAVQYVKFPLGAALSAAAQKDGADLRLGVDHPEYSAELELEGDLLASLREDLASD